MRFSKEPGRRFASEINWQTSRMAMRQDCKFFESRTYGNGETVRKCDLDLAPEAPWRCPADCKGYQRRMADVNWQHGTLVTPTTPEAPVDLDEHGDDVAALLDAAEDIVNAAGPSVLAEIEADQARQEGGRLSRLFKRKPKN